MPAGRIDPRFAGLGATVDEKFKIIDGHLRIPGSPDDQDRRGGFAEQAFGCNDIFGRKAINSSADFMP